MVSAAGDLLYTGGIQTAWSLKSSLFLTNPDPPETPSMHREAAATQQVMPGPGEGTCRGRPAFWN
jgi:hypothetical protein